MSDRPVMSAIYDAMHRFQKVTARQPKRVVMCHETFNALRREPPMTGTMPTAVSLFGMPVEIDDRIPAQIVRVVWDEEEMWDGGIEHLHSFALAHSVADGVVPEEGDA